jgi:transposase
MEALSLDLRERVAAACDEGSDTQPEIAERFGVSVSFITKLLRRRRLTGSLAAKARGGGRKPALGARDLDRVRRLVAEQRDATLAELCDRLRARGGPAVGAWTMCRALRTLGLPRKKSPSTRASVTRLG